MKLKTVVIFFLCGSVNAKLTMQPSIAREIGKKIWANECAGTIDGLTSWNQGEDFASLGIGHFIWHPPGKKIIFKESFPSLITFIKSHNYAIPRWLDKAIELGCPWHTRDHFLKNFESERMKELRKLLSETIDLQVMFIIGRLEKTLNQIIQKTSKKSKIRQQFNRVYKSPNGLYVLIDYINFKGEGINPQEQYNNEGWGLFQVLEKMKGVDNGSPAIEEFVKTAKKILAHRVKNAPAERNEERWLLGWNNRLDTYLKK